MKKTLLLSVVASTLIMAGGDIEPVAVPVVEEVSNWEFGGQGVLYYQTGDFIPGDDLFDQHGSRANAGIQLRAVNQDVFWGIGAGAEVSGVATLGLENDVVAGVMQGANEDIRGGWISQAYLTYGFGNTSIKAGRQELPKGLSPFAFSEGWNVFKNTFDAVLLVNTDITDTTLVGAWVEGGNYNNIYGAPTGGTQGFVLHPTDIGGNALKGGGDMAHFEKVNGGAGIFMLTAQNKSVESLTLTGSYYYAAEYLSNILPGIVTSNNDAHILWGDASYNGFEGFNVAGQVGSVMSDDFNDDTIAWGLKAGGNWDMFSATLAYSSVDDGGVGVFNVGGVKTPLYTQLILNQDAIRADSDTVVAKAGLKTSFGKFGIAYNYSELGAFAAPATAMKSGYGSGTYSELDLTYKVNVWNDSTTLFAGYIYQADERDAIVSNGTVIREALDTDANTIRVWGRYNF